MSSSNNITFTEHSINVSRILFHVGVKVSIQTRTRNISISWSREALLLSSPAHGQASHVKGER